MVVSLLQVFWEVKNIQFLPSPLDVRVAFLVLHKQHVSMFRSQIESSPPVFGQSTVYSTLLVILSPMFWIMEVLPLQI
jgi:hypothetical protein